MAKMPCSSENVYLKDGRCCKRCPPGTYVQADCDGTEATQCGKCKHGFYTATQNHLKNCQLCSVCSSENNQRKAKDCTDTQNTVCECEAGFYCNNDKCDHCQPVTHCPVGEGVKVPASRTNDTICAPCEKGTYSNVTDFLSPCKAHTRCEDIGRELKIPGTPTTNAICSDILPRCSWMLPAGLWSGLVLTAFVLFAGVICWKAKRKSFRAVDFKKKTLIISSAPDTLTEVVPAPPVTLLDLPLPLKELHDHCQETCTVEECKSPLFQKDDNVVSCDVDSSHPITPLKVSVSFAESNHNTEIAGYCTSNFFRTYSEPQEDEWCGT